MALPWDLLDSVETNEGVLELRRRGADFLISVGGRVLMNSRARRSEEALGELAGRALSAASAPRVLVGGLGMGYTLRSLLDVLPEDAKVRVVELNPVVVRWCRGPLAECTADALADPRVETVVGDAAAAIREGAKTPWDAIVLDLYEGPHAATQGTSDPFFSRAALGRARKALRSGGVLAVWGENPDRPFEDDLRRLGFAVERHRPGRAGARHVVYLATPDTSRR